jgi:hypothetical protein
VPADQYLEQVGLPQQKTGASFMQRRRIIGRTRVVVLHVRELAVAVPAKRDGAVVKPSPGYVVLLKASWIVLAAADATWGGIAKSFEAVLPACFSPHFLPIHS